VKPALLASAAAGDVWRQLERRALEAIQSNDQNAAHAQSRMARRRAGCGQAAAALPMSVMNSRRFMACPKAKNPGQV